MDLDIGLKETMKEMQIVVEAAKHNVTTDAFFHMIGDRDDQYTLVGGIVSCPQSVAAEVEETLRLALHALFNSKGYKLAGSDARILGAESPTC